MKATKRCFSASGIFLCVGIAASAYEVSQGPTELIQYDPSRAYEGYTLFSPMLGRNTYLIDMQGQVVNMWSHPEPWVRSDAREHARLLEDGTLLRAYGSPNGQTPSALKAGLFQIVDWDGGVVWEYENPREGYSAHPDVR